MPELPEVEAARKAVHESCCSRRIVEATVANDTIVIDSVTPSVLENALVGRTILGAHRKGKNLWLELDARPWPSFQFGMTGAFSIKGKDITKYKRSAVSDKEEWPSKFSKVFLKLDDGLEVSFTDKRRLARVRLLDDPIAAPPISELGPDAFLELPAETTFMSSILKKRCPIKALIMDQNFLAGIGNWVADEVLYQARIHPEQVASSLSETECMRLHKTIQEVLKLSVDVNADSEMFPKDWIFDYRWNKKPGEVGGEKISFITVGGRTSAIVPALQKCTLQSSRKKGNSIDGLVDENGTENVTTKTKRKSGRKEQTSKAAPPPDGEDLVVKNKKSSTKESLPVSKAEPKKGRGKIRAASKQIEEAEKESKLAVSRGKKTGKALKPRDQKEESPESRLELGKQQVKAPARKRSGKEEPTEVARTSRVGSAHNEKVSNKANLKRTKKVEVSKEEEEVKAEKGEPSKKEQGQKRKRGVK